MKKEIETEASCHIVEKRGKRKTNPNQRDKLNSLYEKIFLKRAEKVSASDRRKGITPYMDDKEAWVIRLLLKHKPGKRETNPLRSYEKLVVRVLVKRDDSDLNRKKKEQNARNQLKEILQSEFFCSVSDKLTDICNKYIKRKKEIYDLYCDYYLGAESVFDRLNSNEVMLWDYLHRLYKKYKEKYAGKKDAEQHDISLKKNRCAWEILVPDERESLAELVMNLDDDKGTYLKYIRGGSVHSDVGERYLHSLVADISDNSYDITFMRSKKIVRTLQCTTEKELLSNTETKKLYDDLKEKIKKAEEICFKIDRIINKKLLDEYTQEFQNALKERKKKQIKSD